MKSYLLGYAPTVTGYTLVLGGSSPALQVGEWPGSTTIA